MGRLKSKEIKVKTKKKCENCPRIVRPGKLTIHKVTGKKLCFYCIRTLGTNKFYNPLPKKEYHGFGNYSISRKELGVLFRKYKKENPSLSDRELWKKVWYQIKYLKSQRIISRINQRKPTQNQQFLEGLKQ